MAINCIRLKAQQNFGSKIPEPLADTNVLSTNEKITPSQASDEEARRMGDYRDILSLTRVLVYGPQSKADADIIIERCVISWEHGRYNFTLNILGLSCISRSLTVIENVITCFFFGRGGDWI